jgi:hypothetical protein
MQFIKALNGLPKGDMWTLAKDLSSAIPQLQQKYPAHERGLGRMNKTNMLPIQ